jgi:hypothetical protein
MASLKEQHQKNKKKQKTKVSNLTILLSSLVFAFSSQKFKIYYNGITLPWALVFSYYSTSLPLSPRTRWTTLVDNVGLKTCLLGP